MTAHVALHVKDGAGINLWPVSQIMDAFFLLAPPSIDFSVWAARAGIDAATADDRADRQTSAGVRMAEDAHDLRRDGILSVEDA
jgi:hypothetical protein